MEPLITRREFVFSPLVLLPGGVSEEAMKEKIMQSPRLKLESLVKLQKIQLLKESDFSVHYALFENNSSIIFGSASLNFKKDKRILDFGIDGFTLVAKAYLEIANLFSGKNSESAKLLALEDKRFSSEFDKNFNWTKYAESSPSEKSSTLLPNYNHPKKDDVLAGGRKQKSKVEITHNPLSLVFDVLMGKLATDFVLVTEEEKYSKVSMSYKKIEGLIVAESEFPNPIAGEFGKVYGVLYNNIPVSGYLCQMPKEAEEGKKAEDPVYLRGELVKIEIDGKKVYSS